MKKLLGVLAFVCLAPLAASATPIGVNASGGISVTGSLSDANAVDVFAFDVTSPGEVQIQSWGYGGGINLAGQTIAAGGFQSNLTLFDASGNVLADSASFLNSNGDSCPNGNLESDGSCGDPELDVASLSDGTYYVGIVAANNYATGGNLDVNNPTLAFSLGSGSFVDSFGTATADYAYDIMGNVQVPSSGPTPTPEPATWLLLGAGVGLAGLWQRRQALAAGRT